MMKNIFLALLAVLVILNIKMYLDINKTHAKLNGISNEVQNLNNNINNIESNVSNTMRKIYNNNQWLYNSDYFISDLSKDLEKVTVTLKWSLHDLNKGSKIYLLYGVEDNKNGDVAKWNEVPAEDLGNLNYQSQLALPFRNNYQFKVISKNDETIVSERLTEINFLSSLNNRIDINITPQQKSCSGNHVNFKFSTSIDNRYDLEFGKFISGIDENLLKIKNIKLKIYSNEQLKEEIQILKDGEIVDKNASFEEPFKNHNDIKLQRIEYETNIEYDSTSDSNEKVEVIVEDYMGTTYNDMSHEM
jgi:cell division protein FtsB